MLYSTFTRWGEHDLNRLINLRLALILLAAVLSLFGIGNAFVAVFWQARHEVTWNYDVGRTWCSHGHCAFNAFLQVANTGEDMQVEVVVQITGVPPGVGGSPWVINLSAAAPRSGDPIITQGREGDRYFVRLRELAPGALTEFRFQGVIPANAMPAPGEPEVTVQGEGRIVEGDPRGLALARWFG